MADRRSKRTIICGACGERVHEDGVQDAYRTTDDSVMRVSRHGVPGRTLTHPCPDCYGEWDVETDGRHVDAESSVWSAHLRVGAMHRGHMVDDQPVIPALLSPTHGHAVGTALIFLPADRLLDCER